MALQRVFTSVHAWEVAFPSVCFELGSLKGRFQFISNIMVLASRGDSMVIYVTSDYLESFNSISMLMQEGVGEWLDSGEC